MNLSLCRRYLDQFKGIKTLVIGDVMLDHYVWGAVSRISPEAPVPVVEVQRESEMPGGAGNVASNLASLGADVSLLGLIGQDSAAHRLSTLLKKMSVHTDPLVEASDRPTILKTRVMAHHQQVVRVDFEKKGGLPAPLQSALLKKALELIPECRVIILSDYGKGVLSSELVSRVVKLARQKGIPVLVDPKPENFRFYQKITCMTPNLKEAREGAGVHSVNDEKSVEALGIKILKQLQADSILITRGEMGMSLFEKNKKPYHIPTRAREVFDVTGAGDTVISTLALALAAKAPMRLAAELANYAAGIVVGKVGASSVTPDELEKVLKSNA